MRSARHSSVHSDTHKPYQPAIGAEIEIEEVPTIEARTRGFLARYIAISVSAAIAVSGAYGLFTGNFTAVEVVWAVAGPIVGAMVLYYFGPQRNDTG